MNRREFYRPLTERTLENYQTGHLCRKYDFSKESRVAALIVREVNRRMDDTESILGVDRAKPFELCVKIHRKTLKLPLFRPEYLEPMFQGEDFASSRALVISTCLGHYRNCFPDASTWDVLSIIDPWSLLKRKGPGIYKDELEKELVPYDEGDSSYWGRFIDAIRPAMPTSRLGTLDTSAPASVVKGLAEFVSTEAGIGKAVAFELVQEVIALRNIVSPRTRELASGEMPLIVTHVNAHLSEEVQTRFRRHAPVYVTVWTEEELNTSPTSIHLYLESLKRRILRVCFEAYRQNGLLTLMELQWIFQMSAIRIGELIQSVQREHNIVVPTPGTILDAGRSITHKDIIVGLHLQGYDVKEIARITHHSPRSVDNYVGTFESVLILDLYGVPPQLIARLLNKGKSLIREHLDLITKFHQDESTIREYLIAKGVAI